jgi:hypothetical protein
VIEREPQQSPQARDHLVGGVWIAVDQLCHGIQGIEQKVGLELHPQQLQVSLGEPGL